MESRFAGKEGQRVAIEALLEQPAVNGNGELAKALVELGSVVDTPSGTAIIEQGAQDNDVYFILSGSFRVLVNGRQVATRKAGTHVGEMAAIQPTQPRSATVQADENSVCLRISETQFSQLANSYPQLWRLIAKELSRRLVQRNQLVTQTRDRVRLFILCSVEALGIARAVQNAFQHDPVLVVVWTDGVFRASHYPVEDLEREVDQSDFAIAIAFPDDVSESRGAQSPTPRDNVVFELGFFMGRLGRARTFLIEPRDEKVKLPSDLSGLTTLSYRIPADTKDLSASVAPACNQIREIVNDLGPKE